MCVFVFVVCTCGVCVCIYTLVGITRIVSVKKKLK